LKKFNRQRVNSRRFHMSEKQIIRNHDDILLVIKRLSLEIAENHVNNKQIYLVGLNERGFFLANSINTELSKYLNASNIKAIQMDIQNNQFIDQSEFTNIRESVVIIIDDVVNSGYTTMKTIAHFFGLGFHTIETAFLAQREHLSYPVLANYVGLSIATTLKDHVYFDNSNPTHLQLYLA